MFSGQLHKPPPLILLSPCDQYLSESRTWMKIGRPARNEALELDLSMNMDMIVLHSAIVVPSNLSSWLPS